jgi:hypothetical protein
MAAPYTQAMGRRQADNGERVLQGQACLEGMHEECGHWHGYRSAFNPRRLRREGFTILCGCGCHSSCPVTSEKNTVGDPAWRQSCTCPGAEAVRRMLDEPAMPFDVHDFAEMWAKSRREFRSRREAFTAAQASAGRDRERLEDLYAAELRSRGLNVPDDDLLGAAIAAHTSSYPTGARLVGREVVNLGKRLGSFRHPR